MLKILVTYYQYFKNNDSLVIIVRQVRAFLGNLAYDTVGMFTEVFPLNIGYISAYCEKLFGPKIEITLKQKKRC